MAAARRFWRTWLTHCPLRAPCWWSTSGRSTTPAGRRSRITKRPEATLREVIDDYLSRTDPTRGDYINKKRHAEVWMAALGAKLAHQILPGDIERHVAKWRDKTPNSDNADSARGLSGASINRLLAFLKRAYSVAIKDKLCDSNPVRDIAFEPEFA